MQKQKSKKYNTKKRRIEKKKWLVVIILTAIAATGIKIHGNMVTTEIVLASDYGQVSIERTESETAEELTIKEHICVATNGENCNIIYNLCTHESFIWLKDEPPCQKYSVNKNTNGTWDYSYLQINDVHIIGRKASKGRGTITMDCVYDLYCVSRWANEKINDGGGHIWVAWSKI